MSNLAINSLFNPLDYLYIKRGVELGHFTLQDDSIFYIQTGNRKQKLTARDPEELVRAEIYLDLVTK